MRLLNIKAKDSAFLRYNKGISTKLFLPFISSFNTTTQERMSGTLKYLSPKGEIPIISYILFSSIHPYPAKPQNARLYCSLVCSLQYLLNYPHLELFENKFL